MTGAGGAHGHRHCAGHLALRRPWQAHSSSRRNSRRRRRFRSSVDVVSVAAVVRDRKGRFVTDLSQEGLRGRRGGAAAATSSTSAPKSNGPVKLALLFDVSGSMRMAQRTVDARQAARAPLRAASRPRDEAAVFSFDTHAESRADVHRRTARSFEAALDRRRHAVRPDVALRRDRGDGADGRRRVEVGAGGAAAAQRGRRAHRRRRHAQPDDAGAGLGDRERDRRAGLHRRGRVAGGRPARERGRAASGRRLESPGARAQDRRRAVHHERAGAREHRGAPDRRASCGTSTCSRSKRRRAPAGGRWKSARARTATWCGRAAVTAARVQRRNRSTEPQVRQSADQPPSGWVPDVLRRRQ